MTENVFWSGDELTADGMNRVLPYVVRGDSLDKVTAALPPDSDARAASLKTFYEETAEWVANNPLESGQTYSPVAT